MEQELVVEEIIPPLHCFLAHGISCVKVYEVIWLLNDLQTLVKILLYILNVLQLSFEMGLVFLL